MINEKMIGLLPIETERLIIRETSIKDIDLILKMDKQEDTQRYLGGIKNQTKEERIAFLERKAEKFKNKIAGSLTVYLKESNIPIGFTGLSINENDKNAEISYIYDSDYTNKGYCTEACKRLLEIAFKDLELNRVYANTTEGNKGSSRVLEKLGFIHEGTRRRHVYVKDLDQYLDFLDYGILREEYKYIMEDNR